MLQNGFMKNSVLMFLIACGVACLSSSKAVAQIKKPGITIGGSVMVSNPQGSFGDAYNFGAGVEARAGIGWGNSFIIGTAGFQGFNAESKTLGTLTYMPLKLGMRQYFLKKILFINADLGIASVKNKLMSEGRFTRGIGVGAKLLGLELALYYDGWKNKNASGFSNFVDAKVGWSFSL